MLQPEPDFCKTTDSNEWVRQTFRVQERYARVLLVCGGEPESIAVAPLDLNAVPAAWNGSSAAGRPHGGLDYPVTKVFRTIQSAMDESRGGDLVAVMPGTYAGFDLDETRDTGDGRYIHVKALGEPGQVTIDRTAEGRNDRIVVLLRNGCSHVIVEGFNIAGRTGPGLPAVGPIAGILLGGTFAGHGRQVHHIALVGNFSHNHSTWGFHSVESHTVLMQDNCFAFSRKEHSAYISNGSDNYLVRRNVFFGSSGCGLHMNMDEDCSLRAVLRHPAMKDYPPYRHDHAYVAALLKAAEEVFGRHNFPDGRGFNHIVECNVMNANGRDGGGTLNMGNVQDSLVQNNLLYGNFCHGIAAYNDSAGGTDRQVVLAAADHPERLGQDEWMPIFGCSRNLIRNNTVLQDVPGRYALGLVNGGWGNRVRNNICMNGRWPSIEVTSASAYRHDSGYNVANNVRYGRQTWHFPGTDRPVEGEMPAALKALAARCDEDNHSSLGVTMDQLAGQFVRYGTEPWVIFEGNWWRLNPDRPDFCPRRDSTLLTGTGDADELPPTDLAGRAQPAADIGAFAAAAQV